MMDRSALWIAMADLLFAVLAVVIVCVNPKADAGIQSVASFLVTVTWPNTVEVDADVDLWVLPPPGDHPVYFRNRESGLAFLDQDCLGHVNSAVRLADGTYIDSKVCKETVSLRGIVPGRYDVALNLYNSNHKSPSDLGLNVKAHVEIIKVNPRVETVWQGDVSLDHVTETVNVASFELTKDNDVTLVSVPLVPITEAFQK